MIEWDTGANSSGVSYVESYDGSEITLVSAPAGPFLAGDEFRAMAGCGKRVLEDCRDKFDNVVNFQGEPHRPGVDQLTAPPV